MATVLGRRLAWWEQMVQRRTADAATTWSAYKWWVAGIIRLAAVIVALSFEALTLALPTMMASMRVGLNEMSWTITAYMISRTLFVGSVGWLGIAWGIGINLPSVWRCSPGGRCSVGWPCCHSVHGL